MKVLFILSQTPYPWWLYGRSSYYFTLLSLSKFIDVHVSFPVPIAKEEYQKHLKERGINSYPFILDTKDRYYKLLLNLFEREPFKIRKYWNIDYKNFLIDLTRKIKPDIIQVHTPHMAFYGIELKKNFPEIPVILRMQDIVSQQIRTFLSTSKNPIEKLIALWQLKKTQKYEINVWKFFEKVIFLTKTDLQDAFEICSKNNSLNFGEKFIYIMDGIEVKENLYLKHKNKENTIAFAASDQIQNIKSLKWFLNEIWSKIYTRTKFSLNIYGKICEHFKKDEKKLKLKRVFLKGFIEDRNKLDMELVKNRLFLSPTIVGSGYRTKILEAGAIGMPVICTTFDFKPFADYLKPHEHILVADTEKEFLEILKNVENSTISLEKISQTFYLTLKEKFSWDDTAKKFVNLYSQLISNKKNINEM